MVSSLAEGQKYGLWEVDDAESKAGVLCRCECGIQKRVRASDLKSGKSRMCRQCSVESSNTTHGMRNTPEYNTWMHMIQRCHNENNKDYGNYGGRGIRVCDMWRESFEAFYMCIGPKPSAKHTIERMNTDGHYEPNNVTWATRTEQNRNQRSNVLLTINGVTNPVSVWAEHPDCPVSQFTIYKRINRGWTHERAVFEPSKV